MNNVVNKLSNNVSRRTNSANNRGSAMASRIMAIEAIVHGMKTAGIDPIAIAVTRFKMISKT
jgi:hypothetical protein